MCSYVFLYRHLIMPKVKLSIVGRFQGFQAEFCKEFISMNNKILFYKAYEKKLCSKKRYQLLQHINTSKHKELVL